MYNRRGGGRLYRRIKYLRSLVKPTEEECESNDCDQDQEPSENLENYAIDFNQEVTDLRSLVVNETNLNDFTEKLKITFDYRHKMLENKETDLLQEFPYFFTHAKLVIIMRLQSFCFFCR